MFLGQTDQWDMLGLAAPTAPTPRDMLGLVVLRAPKKHVCWDLYLFLTLRGRHAGTICFLNL